MWKNRILYLLALISALIFHGFFYEWFSEYLLLMVLVLPVFSLVISLPAMCSMGLGASSSEDVPLGGNAVLVLWTRCKLPQPRCKFCVTVKNPLTNFSRRYKFRPDRLRVVLRLPTEHCGSLHCGVTRCRVCDYLGLFALPRRWKHTCICHITPAPVALQTMPSLENFLPQGFYPKAGGGMSEYHELRDYQPGDNLRQIHWKLSAKLDTPIVREPQIPAFPKMTISVDLSLPPQELDTLLGKTICLSQFLLDHQIPHYVCWISGTTAQERSMEHGEDIGTLMYALIESQKAGFSKETDFRTCMMKEGGLSYGHN